jgi:hypothetical protein
MPTTLPPNTRAVAYAAMLGLDPSRVAHQGFVIEDNGARDPKTGEPIYFVTYRVVVTDEYGGSGTREVKLTTKIAPPA